MLGCIAGKPITELSCAEKLVFAATTPRSAVEYTPAGSVGLEVANGANETQNECPVASLDPFVAFNVTSDMVTAVAGLVVTVVLADGKIVLGSPVNVVFVAVTIVPSASLTVATTLVGISV